MKPINQTNFIAYPHQKASLDSRRDHDLIVNCLGFELVILPDVYATNLDTELMGKTVKIRKNKDFLEIGAGSGAVAIYVSRRARKGVAVDSSPAAVRNICLNVRRAGIKNLEVIKSNLFSNVKGKFDVIIFNPPYSNYKARSLHDRMFWDPGNRSKKAFFAKASKFLKPNGRVYFGWANFKDLDYALPEKLAKKHKFNIVSVSSKHHRYGFDFLVYELVKKN